MIYESTIANMQRPDRKTTKAFRFNFFNGRPGSKDSFPLLDGQSSSLYDDANDLIALQVAENPDRLTTFVRDNFGFLFQVGFQHDHHLFPHSPFLIVVLDRRRHLMEDPTLIS